MEGLIAIVSIIVAACLHTKDIKNAYRQGRADEVLHRRDLDNRALEAGYALRPGPFGGVWDGNWKETAEKELRKQNGN